jgi:CMP-N-acetylneuraminic acid synthetase
MPDIILPREEKIIAVIPVRMGSQRLTKKNLRELNGIPLIQRVITKCLDAKIFDEIWVNSEDVAFKRFAEENAVAFHQRSEELGNNQATSEEYLTEFLEKHDCSHLVQVHSIAPLLRVKELVSFVEHFKESKHDVLLSCTEEQIECAFDNSPVNFKFSSKTNSQELKPIQKVTWSITGWRRESFLQAINEGKCATYFGTVGYFPLNRLSGHIIKTKEDLLIAEALLPLIESSEVAQ